VALYVVFGSLLIATSIVADYARVRLALLPRVSILTAVAESLRFIRAHGGSVLGLYLATGALFVLLLIAYGAVEIAGDVEVGGWRGVAIAQAYIVARVAIRLAFGASELRLYRALAAAQGPSSACVMPGPPSAR